MTTDRIVLFQGGYPAAALPGRQSFAAVIVCFSFFQHKSGRYQSAGYSTVLSRISQEDFPKNSIVTNDPAWITGKGFVNTGYYLQTTSKYYRIYKKSYMLLRHFKAPAAYELRYNFLIKMKLIHYFYKKECSIIMLLMVSTYKFICIDRLIYKF